MEQKYQNWISENVDTQKTYGKCIEITKKMVEHFPELKIVYGTYECLIWGTRWHQWLVTESGEIIDPTVFQFPTQGGKYTSKEEYEIPKGKCVNCGELYYNDYSSTVCSEYCGNVLADYLNNFNKY